VRLSAGKAEAVLFPHPDVEDVVGECCASAGVAVEDDDEEEKGSSHDVSPVSLFQ
jgi:hypothetical protein